MKKRHSKCSRPFLNKNSLESSICSNLFRVESSCCTVFWWTKIFSRYEPAIILVLSATNCPESGYHFDLIVQVQIQRTLYQTWVRRRLRYAVVLFLRPRLWVNSLFSFLSPTRGMATTRHRSLVERGGRKALLETLHTHQKKKRGKKMSEKNRYSRISRKDSST